MQGTAQDQRRFAHATGTGPSLIVKYGFALASLAGYVALALLAEHVAATGRMQETGSWFHHAAGAVFGALVLGPYAAPGRRVVRILALAAAGAAMYWLAVRFVADVAIPYPMIVSLVIAGSLAALLCGLAVVAIAPCHFHWGIVPLLLSAGALGAAAFEIRIPNDEMLLIGHAAWQLLVCLALHFGLRPGGATSSSA